MITIQPLLSFDAARLGELIAGYVSDERYAVERVEGEAETTFALRLERLPAPYHKTFTSDEAEIERYREVAQMGYSLGAWEAGRWVGVALAEPHLWNHTLWVWEFHIAPQSQGGGVGRALMQALIARAESAGLRALVCETQSTNVPAIRFYRRLGFHLDGIDLSYYTNQDYPHGEMAIFMKRQIGFKPG